LLTFECLASCGTAPVLQVNDDFVENLTLEKADALLEKLDQELKKPSVGATFTMPGQ
jgi:NADH:ubiquinone oxidoreductase subunit E